jgi:hypothetical protein
MIPSVADHTYLVAYDYGIGALWAVVIAPSPEAIVEKYSELKVVPERPQWMDEERYQQLLSERLWLDDEPPQGMLRAVVADRVEVRDHSSQPVRRHWPTSEDLGIRPGGVNPYGSGPQRWWPKRRGAALAWQRRWQVAALVILVFVIVVVPLIGSML